MKHLATEHVSIIDDRTSLFKDAVLDRLAATTNVAQFVSFAPDLSLRYSRVRHSHLHASCSAEQAVAQLLQSASSGTVNIRTFAPEQPKGGEFLYGVASVGEVAAALTRLGGMGLYAIVNETIDVSDGGVSGVVFGEMVEFAPGDTPRCVEKPDAVSLPRELALRLLQTVYHFRPSLDFETRYRVEFSIHPLRTGYRHEHTIIWELEPYEPVELTPVVQWPNRFSRLIGDKPFGLLVAHLLGLPVPATTVVSRAIAPFAFGQSTGTSEIWIRTCPAEQNPGRFPTYLGWRDPFKLLQDQDPSGNTLVSVIAQHGVEAHYSGALATTSDGSPLIEGVSGRGDDFMLGRRAPDPLPQPVITSVANLHRQAVQNLAAARIEWVHDLRRTWVIQLHQGPAITSPTTLCPGPALTYTRFDVSQGIEALRSLISEVRGTGTGIILVGNIGVTSHMGDLLRRARVPSRLERST